MTSTEGKGHTGGPWTIHDVEVNGLLYYAIHAEPKNEPQLHSVAYVTRCEGDAELAANARLIAAAPDLQDSLRDMLKIAEAALRASGSYDPKNPRIVKARTALSQSSSPIGEQT